MFKSNNRPRVSGPLSSYGTSDPTTTQLASGGVGSTTTASLSLDTKINNNNILSILFNKRVLLNLACSLTSKLLLHPLSVLMTNKQLESTTSSTSNTITIHNLFKFDGICGFLRGIEFNFYIFIPQALLGASTLVLLSPYRKVIDSYFVAHLLINIGMYPLNTLQFKHMIIDKIILINKKQSSSSVDSTTTTTTGTHSDSKVMNSSGGSSDVEVLKALPNISSGGIYSKSIVESLVDKINNLSLFNITKVIYHSIHFEGLSIKLIELTLYYYLNKYTKWKLNNSQLLGGMKRGGLMKSIVVSLLSTFIPLLITHPIETIHNIRRMQYIHKCNGSNSNDSRDDGNDSRDGNDNSHSQYSSVIGIVKDLIKKRRLLSLYNGYIENGFKTVLHPILTSLLKTTIT